jgi:serine phosphatase RsbU (regulator of sigma subunit)
MTVPSHVLIVDDNADNRDLLARILTKQGHTFSMATNGQEALAMLAAAHFDLVLLDIMMPVLNGIETLRRIAKDGSIRHIPVIVVSAIDDVENVVSCIELGAEDYLFKPVNKVILNARVSACLEKKRLRDQEQAYLTHVRQELELGRQIQSDFLPAILPALVGWECAVSFLPAFEVAGDFYDLFMLQETKLCIVIADVCGKGVGAALFMALVRSLMRAFAEQGHDGTGSILHAAKLTNDYITKHHRQKKSYMFATLFFGVLDTKTGEIDYITAGHYPPLILGNHATVRSLELCGPALGITGSATFPIKKSVLEPGEIMFAYTDGVIEAKNENEDLFTQERLLSILQDPVKNSHALLHAIEKSLKDHEGTAQSSDDITMVAVKREIL